MQIKTAASIRRKAFCKLELTDLLCFNESAHAGAHRLLAHGNVVITKNKTKNNLVRLFTVPYSSPILGDPGAVSGVGRNSATNVLKHGRKSPLVPTLTGTFRNGQANTGSWLGTKNALYYCAQSANSISWVLFVSSYIRLLTRSRLVWLMHQRNARSQETFSLI